MVTASIEADQQYSPLKDVRVEIDGSDRSFVLCFWLYLPSSTPFPSTVLTQMHSEMTTSVPFLMLDEKKKMMLLPLIFLHKEAPIAGFSIPWTKFPHASTKTVFPIGEWVYVRCEDLELLRHIAGCEKLVARENFEKLWCWLYPVADTLSRVWVNALWNSAPPKRIEGFITKEETESSPLGLKGMQDPETFVLRFPTSRSWPHPGAGNLVVTCVGSDYTHHKMLSLDFVFSSGGKPNTSTPLQDLLLAEPELSRFGRNIRTH